MAIGWETPPKTFEFEDWGEPVEQRTLRELGLPLKYARAKDAWHLIESGSMRISADSYPYIYARPRPLTVQGLWESQDVFRDNFATPSAMLWALLHPIEREDQ